MSRTKGALGKKNRISSTPILTGLGESKQIEEKKFITQENNQCDFKELCETNIHKNNYNDTCYNPVYCLNNFDGKCKLIVRK